MESPVRNSHSISSSRLPLAELRLRAVDRLERVGHRHLLPEPEGVERCTEQREAAVGQEAVRKADVLQSPFGLLRRESLHEPVQRLPASVVVSGSGGFGECGFPVEDGERRAVGAEVGQPDIGLLPFGGRARPGQRCGQAVVAAQRVINKAPERVFREIGRIRFL